RYEGRSFGRRICQPAVILDFGALVNGYIQLDIEADENLVLDVTYAQALRQGRLYPESGGILRFNRYVLRAGRQQIESFEWHNLRYLQLTVRGDTGKGYASRIAVHSVCLRTIEYPTPVSGSFDCSDPLLTSIWEATQKTTRLCMLDVFMDNTFREKGGWGGDVSQIVLSALTCFGPVAVVKRYLNLFILEQSPSGVIPGGVPGWGGTGMGNGAIFDHAMAIPMRIVQYYEYSADLAFFRSIYPALRRYMDFMERYETEDGILAEVPGYVWFDWADLDKRLPSVLLNFYYCILLESMQKAAAYAGYPADQAIFSEKANNIRAYASRWWCEEPGAFPDSSLSDRFVPFSEQTNALALLCLNNRDQINLIIDNVFSRGFDIHGNTDLTQAGPPFALYVLEGLCKTGRHDLACDLIRQRHGLAIASGLETMPESWIFFPNGETSAAQGTLAAAYILTGEILGIKPGAPGFSTVLLEPHPSGLRWASGDLPIPAGLVNVQWKNEDTFTMQIMLPPQTMGLVRLPCRNDCPPNCDTAQQIECIGDRWCVHLSAGSHWIKLDYRI
ncbi:MAG TPA: hypothetical protein DD640_07855, partial [Clostridiales bacterium]|nr:hypothetical protein [Clostridiales bacterium]